MKTTTIRMFFILLVLSFISRPILAQTSQVVYNNPQHTSGSLTLSPADCQYDGWHWGWEINIPANTPIKVTSTINIDVYLQIYTNESGSSNSIFNGYGPGSNIGTAFSSIGKIFVYTEDDGDGAPSSDVFTINFSVDNSYTMNQNTATSGDAIVGGKLDVKGDVEVDSHLGIGSAPSSNAKLYINNSQANFSLYSINSLQTAGSTYGLLSNAYNNSGSVYGIYSYVSGGGTANQRWAGYFTGGDVEVYNGNLKVTGNGKVGIGVTDPQGSLQVRGTYDNSWIYFSSNAGLNSTKYKPKVAYGMAFTWNYSGGYGESIINYSTGVGSSPRLDFTSFDGTNLTTEMTLKKGSLGIGTTTPQAKLDVGAFINGGQLGTVFGRLPEGNTTGDGTYLGVAGYGTQPADYNSKGFSIEHHFYGQTNSSINFFRGAGTTGGYLTFNTSENSEKMRINANGNVSIGTTDTDPTGAMLTVKGSIHTKEVIVDLNAPLADFVFTPTYKLMPLHEVEQYVTTNSHLPEMPSADEVSKNGLNMGEMQNKLLQKMEEMTLYMIEQNKAINELNQVVKVQNEKIVKLETASK